MYIKLPYNYQCILLYGAWTNDFDGGKSITLAIGRGRPRKSRPFQVKMTLRSLATFGDQKIQGLPLPMAQVMDLSASKSLHPTPYKQQLH
jgi:hypothetical protein